MESTEKIIVELFEKGKNHFTSSWKYDFLLTKEFLSFFSNQESIFADYSKDGMVLGAAYLGYSDTTRKFETTIRDYLEYEWLRSEVEKTGRVNYIKLWRKALKRYNEKYITQNVERLLQENAKEISADEIVAAIVYCTIGGERLCTGFFVSCCEEGLIGQLLLRLKEIRKIELSE